MTDPIADMLMRIRDAAEAKHARVDIPASKLKLEIARVLKDEGYINNFVVKGEAVKRSIRIFVRMDPQGVASIEELVRVSGDSPLPGITRKSNAPDLIFPKQASIVGREKIEAAVGIHVLKLKALHNKRKNKGFAKRAKVVAAEAK
jgi:ribosomal S8-like protein